MGRYWGNDTLFIANFIISNLRIYENDPHQTSEIKHWCKPALCALAHTAVFTPKSSLVLLRSELANMKAIKGKCEVVMKVPLHALSLLIRKMFIMPC